MDFGRLDPADLTADSGVPLPATDRARGWSTSLGRVARPRILLAAPVWGHAGFVGRIYPRGTPSGKFLAHYAEHFPAVELNTTWYGIRPDQVLRWAAEVPEDFRFFAKIPRTITHECVLDRAEALTGHALRDLGAFGARLGGIFAQLPPEFGPDQVELLGTWLDLIPRAIPVAVELRHPGFFASGTARDEVFGILRARGATAIITDTLGRPDVLHMTVTAPRVFVRFAGNSLHESDYRRLDAWAERILAWGAEGVEEVFFALHQPEEHQTVDLALHLGRRLQAAGVEDLRLPRPLPEEVQGDLFG